MRPNFDLQSHSLHSDGALAPSEVVARAAQAGVAHLALTDHDSVDGIAEALAAAAEHGVHLTPAAEISSIHEEAEDLHVLGYGIDHEHPGLLSALATFREDRVRRSHAMADRLREGGWHLDEADLDAREADGLAIGRPHLAQAILSHPGNAERLAAERLTNVGDVIVAYLIPGAAAFLRRTTPTIPEAIELIHEAGGLAVWAHPFWDFDDPADVLAALDRFHHDYHLDGVEAFYVTHNAEQVALLDDTAREISPGFLTTGSSDFHGPDHAHFSEFLAHDLHGRTPNLGDLAAP